MHISMYISGLVAQKIEQRVPIPKVDGALPSQVVGHLYGGVKQFLKTILENLVMLRKRLIQEVGVPLYVAGKNLVKLSVSEEALYAYLSMLITLICFFVECYDELSNATRWALGCLVNLGEPEVCEIYVDENLYLMPSQDNWDLSAEVKEVISWWKVTAANLLSKDEIEAEVFGGDVIDAEFWTEGCVPCLEAAGSLLCLPPAKVAARSKPRKIKK